MKVTVTGATGNVGRPLVAALREKGHEVTALSRDADSGSRKLGSAVTVLGWPAPKEAPPPPEAIEGQDAVIHLLGEPIDQRWTDEVKRELRDSRVLSTRQVVEGLKAAEARPGVLVSQSASGYYGNRGDEELTESSSAGDDFLADLVVEWEAEADQARELNVRVVTTRTGVVLSREGGALEKMLPFFKLGIGGPVAGGGQYVPWVHLDDVTGSLVAVMQDEAASGPVNVSAPAPATNKELSKTLGRVLRRPALAPVPGLAVKTLYGEMGHIVITGQRMLPKRLEELGYTFAQPELESALRSAIGAR
ncbi:MAG TPA: TIGR01777 family oxidoreductase [Thermoleophilaceae bacterium]|nr:TIGR01777 family oxidoreductase [Thermoleophilaceae bacterium]